MPDILSRANMGVTRRRFLGISGAAFALLAGGEAFEYAREMVRQERAWLDAKSPNAIFLRDHGAAFAGVAIGASFAPEQWPGDARDGADPPLALDWAVRGLGLRHVRLGLRWSRVEAARGVIDLSPYRGLLDYAFDQGLDLCLNVGPIRTFRWPEEHLPAWLPSVVALPPDGSVIRSSSPLTSAASDYLDRLLHTLAGEYGRDRLQSTAVIQTENEPFYPLRTHKWVLSGDYVRETIDQANAFLPDSRVLVTTAGRLNFGPIQDLFTSLLTGSEGYRGRLLMGFDYHYKTPLRDSFPVIRYTDPITFQRVGYQTCEDNREMARSIGYDIEVTEGQAEPFGHLDEPGNSARHFRFMLLRCAERVLQRGQQSLVRIWGIEEMAKKVLARETTPEHEAIFDLVRRINAAATAA